MFTRTLCLMVAVSATLGAQQVLTVHPAPDRMPAGIAILPPADPSFQGLAEKLLPPAAVPLYRHVLPYAALIRNETSTPTIAMILTIRITDAAGRTSEPLVYHLGATPPVKQFVVLGPGRDLLFTAEPRFTQLAPILSTFDDAKQRERLDELAAVSLTPYISAREITLALDSVLFANGTVEGPDELDAFESWTKALHIQSEFDASVLAFEGRDTEELSRYLADVAATPGPKHSWALPDTRGLARHYARVLREKGPEAVFKLLNDDLQKATELTIHR